MKNALVTGSTRGIGAAIAEELVENGYKVFTNGRTSGDIPADLSTLNGVAVLADTIISRCEKLDCLVLNAGETCYTPFTNMCIAEWEKVMNVNVSMPAFLVQRLFNHIADNGAIVFIASDMAIYPHARSPAYGVSKAAVVALARNLVKEFAPRKIRVNAICPGFVDTDWQKEKPKWLRLKIEKKIALERFCKSSEVANLVFSIISNQYINGSVVRVDGGYDFI